MSTPQLTKRKHNRDSSLLLPQGSSPSTKRKIKPRVIYDIEYQTPKHSNRARRLSTKSTKQSTTSKGPWTEGEDKKLIELVEKYGAEKWSYISSFFPERIGKQCRERWFNHLNPSVKKTTWSQEEEWILFIMHRRMGNKWSKLCEYLPGRTDNTIKNHWNSTMQKKFAKMNEEYSEMVYGKNTDEIEEIENNFIEKCRKVVDSDNIRFYDEKIKNYEKFKSIRAENKQTISKLKKILLFRTHSKKTKKRGRKRKQQKAVPAIVEEPEIYASNNYEESQEKSSEKKLTTPIKDKEQQTEKSAFNKVEAENYSKIKTHLMFTSSVKKPVKIISDDCVISDENVTPNKPLGYFEDTFHKGLQFKSLYTSSKKYDGMDLFIDSTPNKFIMNTPFKIGNINNTNLDKMFFSVIQTDYEKTPIKKN